MTLDEAIKLCEEVAKEKSYDYQECIAVHDMEDAMACGKCSEEHKQLAEWLKELKQLRKQTSWIPITYRKPTQKEKDDYYAQRGEELCYMLENEMPLNGQEVLVSCAGIVSLDTFDEDYYDFEGMSIEDVDAWMPMPKSYKAGMERVNE